MAMQCFTTTRAIEADLFSFEADLSLSLVLKTNFQGPRDPSTLTAHRTDLQLKELTCSNSRFGFHSSKCESALLQRGAWLVELVAAGK